MEKITGRLKLHTAQFLYLAIIGGLMTACSQKESVPAQEANAQSEASAKWLAKREESRKAKEAAIASEPKAMVKTEPAFESKPIPATKAQTKDDFAQRLSAIVGTAITSNKELKEKAERGDKISQREWARSLASSGNYEDAAKWYLKSAEQGDAQAQHDLAVLYVNGTGVPQDYAEAVKWFALAAAQGDVESQYSLGLRYLKGDKVEQDFAESVKWFRMAADQGNADAQLSLARRYIAGEGVTKDPVEAYKWSALADANGKWGASDVRDNLAATMTPEQIADAKQRVAAFVPAKKK